MNYPFEFDELLLTSKVLDVLGFSEYWAGSGDFGERCFGVEKVELYRIVEIDEIDDPDAGYGSGEPQYCSKHYCSRTFIKRIYFLHELYEDIENLNPNLLSMFIEKTKEKNVNMYPYIKSFLKYKTNQ